MNLIKSDSSFGQLVRYSIVVLINVAVTALIILLLSMGEEHNLFLANAIGYAVGIVVSLILNVFFTFKKGLSFEIIKRFLIAMIIAYLSNLLVVGVFYAYLPLGEFLVQFYGMLAYVIVGFILNKFWVMR